MEQKKVGKDYKDLPSHCRTVLREQEETGSGAWQGQGWDHWTEVSGGRLWTLSSSPFFLTIVAVSLWAWARSQSCGILNPGNAQQSLGGYRSVKEVKKEFHPSKGWTWCRTSRSLRWP